jgi:hypothetical protein
LLRELPPLANDVGENDDHSSTTDEPLSEELATEEATSEEESSVAPTANQINPLCSPIIVTTRTRTTSSFEQPGTENTASPNHKANSLEGHTEEARDTASLPFSNQAHTSQEQDTQDGDEASASATAAGSQFPISAVSEKQGSQDEIEAAACETMEARNSLFSPTPYDDPDTSAVESATAVATTVESATVTTAAVWQPHETQEEIEAAACETTVEAGNSFFFSTPYDDPDTSAVESANVATAAVWQPHETQDEIKAAACETTVEAINSFSTSFDDRQDGDEAAAAAAASATVEARNPFSASFHDRQDGDQVAAAPTEDLLLFLSLFEDILPVSALQEPHGGYQVSPTPTVEAVNPFANLPPQVFEQQKTQDGEENPFGRFDKVPPGKPDKCDDGDT